VAKCSGDGGGGGNQLGDVADGDTRPSGEVAIADGLEPCGLARTEAASVEVLKEF
jgi:hypothetical protein